MVTIKPKARPAPTPSNTPDVKRAKREGGADGGAAAAAAAGTGPAALQAAAAALAAGGGVRRVSADGDSPAAKPAELMGSLLGGYGSDSE
jgi:hypothetical protein